MLVVIVCACIHECFHCILQKMNLEMKNTQIGSSYKLLFIKWELQDRIFLISFAQLLHQLHSQFKGLLNGCFYFWDNGLLGGLLWLVQKHNYFVGVHCYWYQCDNNFGRLSCNEIEIAVWCGQNCGEWQCLHKQTELNVRVKKKSQQQLCALFLM